MTPPPPPSHRAVPGYMAGRNAGVPYPGVSGADRSLGRRALLLHPEVEGTVPRSEWASAPSWHAPARRAINVLAAVVLLVATAPLMVVIALAVKLTSPGPVLYRQNRIGLDRRRDRPGQPPHPRRQRDLGGRVFQILKFRTMTHRPPSEERQEWAQVDDPRVTPVGRILRDFRLDELPQLFNVLKGDMNLVGPRPEQPEIFSRIRDEIDGYSYRQRVLPGITGLAQVNLNYDQCLDDVRRKVQMDLAYVASESPMEDLRIMARTVPVVLFRKGSQ